MGRRRWRFVTLAAFLLFMTKDTQCQDENDFYYTPVERNFAQVQPPLFPNSRPANFYQQGDNLRVAQAPQQPLYREGHVRFPSPNYNQNPSPFQLPTGRSQAGAQYYVNQPDFSPSQRQRFRPALPYNFQLVLPATTKRPDASQIHSVAYQNDPSKPETFLGQITLNNPDIEILQNNRFKNVQFDSNSLKSNGQSGHISHDEDFDNQDIFDHPRVTTYNPNNHVNKQRLNTRPSSMRLSPHDSLTLDEDDKINYQASPNKILGGTNIDKISKQVTSSTENKALLELEPLLEDDISDINSYRELMKNKKGSFDVEVIKSTKNSDDNMNDDSKPDASSMKADNIPHETDLTIKVDESHTKSTTIEPNEKVAAILKSTKDHSSNNDSQHEEDEGEYVEYYDETETESSEVTQHTTHEPDSTEHVTDIYDEYEEEEPEKITEVTKPNVTKEFDVLVMKKGKTLVKDDNFKHFVDTAVIDQTEQIPRNETVAVDGINTSISGDDLSSIETPAIFEQEVVSVVTTKSVVNGTISIPDSAYPTSTTKLGVTSDLNLNTSQENDTTTENWVVVASVQTSRSVSGARFLPFPNVEQDEKKQVLIDEDEDVETVTKDPRKETSGSINSSSSTENINDKLDTIQSELSSAVLTGTLNNVNKNIELITESTTEQTTTTTSTTTTPSTLNVFTLKNIQVPTLPEKSAPNPLPVNIKKFTHRVTTSTTPKPRKKLVTVMDDLSAGLLPPGYKPRQSFKDKRFSTTTSTTTTSTPVPSLEEDGFNGTQGRSSGISSKNRVILLDDKSLLPKEYKLRENPENNITKNIGNDDISKFLPPGYKTPSPETPERKPSTKPDILDKLPKVDISAFLPKGFKLNITATEKPIKVVPVDIKAFLPPDFKLNSTGKNSNVDLFSNFRVSDISSLLPPGFKPNTTDAPMPGSTTKAPGIKLVFPSRPGSKQNRKTTPKPNVESGPAPVTPKIQKGWPTRASTEFTGWPSSSTTPFSIDKYLNKTDSSTSPLPDINNEVTARPSTTTTTTTTVAPPSTTPGVCRDNCDIFASIKIVSGVKWVPELLDHHTEEWQTLANEMKEELNSVYTKSDILKKWYKGVRIDGFTQGSVLVDYFIELKDVEEKVDTLELKKLFHKSLHEAPSGSVVESIHEEPPDGFDPDIMLGDQPNEERMTKSDEKMTKTIDKSAGKLEIGKFVMDPAYTEFIVLPKREDPTPVEPDEESFLPQWGIAVIVIAMASLLFVVIFGVTVLVNRQKSSKAKQPIPLSEDMLRELDKSHMGGFEDLHQMKERDLPYLPQGKRMSTAFIEQLAYPNASAGDSWRSEWTPQLQKYMQHYTPDSGRGSQIYGTSGNAYGYNGGGGSQLYGQTGGGSQVYGYTGEYPRPHYGRRRSEYDSNF